MKSVNAICLFVLLGASAACPPVPIFRAPVEPAALSGLLSEKEVAGKSRDLWRIVWPEAGPMQVQVGEAGCYTGSTRPGDLKPFWSVVCQSADEQYHLRALWDASNGQLRQVVASREHPGGAQSEYPDMQPEQVLKMSRLWISDLGLDAGADTWKLVSCTKQGNHYAVVRWRSPQTQVRVTFHTCTGQLLSADVLPNTGGRFTPMLSWTVPGERCVRSRAMQPLAN